jgi:hypothetical protein
MQFRRKGKLRRPPCGSGRVRGARRNPPQEIGKLDGKLHPFTNLAGGASWAARQVCRPVGNQGFQLVTKPVAGRRALRYALCQ